MSTDTLNQLLGTATLALQIVTLGLFAAILLRNKIPGLQDVVKQFGAVAFPLAFALALGSAAMTLYYSDWLGIEPCPLCWWQRIFLYPQVILFALALWKNIAVRTISVAFSILGFGFGIYHHALQMLPSGSLPCPAQSHSCAAITFIEYGYITYPLMAATLFAFLIALMWASRITARSRAI